MTPEARTANLRHVHDTGGERDPEATRARHNPAAAPSTP